MISYVDGEPDSELSMFQHTLVCVCVCVLVCVVVVTLPSLGSLYRSKRVTHSLETASWAGSPILTLISLSFSHAEPLFPSFWSISEHLSHPCTLPGPNARLTHGHKSDVTDLPDTYTPPSLCLAAPCQGDRRRILMRLPSPCPLTRLLLAGRSLAQNRL